MFLLKRIWRRYDMPSQANGGVSIYRTREILKLDDSCALVRVREGSESLRGHGGRYEPLRSKPENLHHPLLRQSFEIRVGKGRFKRVRQGQKIDPKQAALRDDDLRPSYGSTHM